MEKMYTVSEAAEMLRVSTRTVRRMISDGVLPAVDVASHRGASNHQWRITEAGIRRLSTNDSESGSEQ
jgi:excisionase family DNA binding protein